jgi:two-component system OmpR family sensor kinase
VTFHPSLRARLTAYASVGSMVLFVVGALLLYHDLTGQLSQAISSELSVRLHDLEAAPLGTTSTEGHRLALTQVVSPDGVVVEPAGARSLLSPAELAVAARHRITIDRRIPQVADDGRLMARSLTVPGEAHPVVGVAAASTKPLEAARGHLTRVLYVTGPALAALFALSTWLLAGAALHPVRRMTREASTISLTSTGERLVQPKGRDEIAELGRTLNDMLTRIERAIAHERSFVDDAAHELRTPLAVLRAELELATYDLGDADAVTASLTSALEETDRLARLTADLLTLARADAGELEPRRGTTDLTVAAQRVADQLRRPERARLEVTGAPVEARADPDWIAQILTNVTANAVRHASSLVRVSIGDAGGNVRLVVADDGAGFPPEFIPEAFDRFSRGADARTRGDEGSGLGLAITATLVGALGGTIAAGNGPPLGGACVTITLPKAP